MIIHLVIGIQLKTHITNKTPLFKGFVINQITLNQVLCLSLIFTVLVA
jgi:hypothetical protein